MENLSEVLLKKTLLKNVLFREFFLFDKKNLLNIYKNCKNIFKIYLNPIRFLNKNMANVLNELLDESL